MYTIVTQLGVYGLDYEKLSKYCTLADDTGVLEHAKYVELKALLRGEKVDVELVNTSFESLCLGAWDDNISNDH